MSHPLSHYHRHHFNRMHYEMPHRFFSLLHSEIVVRNVTFVRTHKQNGGVIDVFCMEIVLLFFVSFNGRLSFRSLAFKFTQILSCTFFAIFFSSSHCLQILHFQFSYNSRLCVRNNGILSIQQWRKKKANRKRLGLVKSAGAGWHGDAANKLKVLL